jgi:hypothetical protein
MLKILLLDCSQSLFDNLRKQGFDVEAGTAGMCTGVRELPSQVYEKVLFFYNPATNCDYGLQRDATPHFPLDHLGNRIEAGATVVAFLNPITLQQQSLNRLYAWIPFMPVLASTHDKLVYVEKFESWPVNEHKALIPVVTTDGLSLPVKVKLIPPKVDKDAYKPDAYNLFYNGNGDCLGILILRGYGRLILLPQFVSNDDVIESFVHRVAPKIYNVRTHTNLTDAFKSPVEIKAQEEVDKLNAIEEELRTRQAAARTELASATRTKVNVIQNDDTARQILVYHDHAKRQEEAALFYLYKMLEVIENKLGGERKAIATLGFETEWKNVKRLANETYRDARHAPKPGDVIRKWTAEEIKKCFSDAAKVVLAYFGTLFP